MEAAGSPSLPDSPANRVPPYRHPAVVSPKSGNFFNFLKIMLAFFQVLCYNTLAVREKEFPKPNGGIAQLGERLNGIQEVSGSIPLISTKNSLFKPYSKKFEPDLNNFRIESASTAVGADFFISRFASKTPSQIFVIFGSTLPSGFMAQSLFLWDGVKGLQTRKSNATAGLSDIYG